MSNFVDVAVIGGGIFGSLCAIEIAGNFKRVALFERGSSLMLGATRNNQNRLHLGYHYPRDLGTAAQCKAGFDEFRLRFSNSILSNFPNYYGIASAGSRTNFDEYRQFCHSAGLPFNPVSTAEVDGLILNVEGLIETEEVVYDVDLLRAQVCNELNESKVSIKLSSHVKDIKLFSGCFQITLESGDKYYTPNLVNCSYYDYNRFVNIFGSNHTKLKYELTVVPVIDWRKGKPPIGITIMDGPFASLLPFGKTGKYLIYHVVHSNYFSEVAQLPPVDWQNPRSIISVDAARGVLSKTVKSASRWIPSIANAEYVEFLGATRVKLANSERTDRRPSMVETLHKEPTFLNVFSGKIDHSVWVSKMISSRLIHV